jgi:hypothetical protein
MASSHAGRGARSRVVVTDGEFKHTLGIVRSLADAGHEVHLLARSSRAPRCIRARCMRGIPSRRSRGARGTVAGAGARLAPVAVIAVGSDAMAAADRLRARWPAGAAIALPSERAFAIANRKDLTAETARAAGGRHAALASCRECRRGACGARGVGPAARAEVEPRGGTQGAALRA